VVPGAPTVQLSPCAFRASNNILSRTILETTQEIDQCLCGRLGSWCPSSPVYITDARIVGCQLQKNDRIYRHFHRQVPSHRARIPALVKVMDSNVKLIGIADLGPRKSCREGVTKLLSVEKEDSSCPVLKWTRKNLQYSRISPYHSYRTCRKCSHAT
jgi:hypothetical protein